jgi:hypothetical protein
MISIDALNSISAGANPYEFEYTFKNGKKSGVFLTVLGDECESVAVEQAALWAAERARRETIEAQGNKYEMDAIKMGQRMAAIRLVGWKGIEDKFSRENAEKLCLGNQRIADEIIKHSSEQANFIKL